jgi:adenylate cyclase, class 2
MNMIEVELKCELFPELLPKLQERLRYMTFAGTAHNVDRYYDTRRFDLLQQAVFVRVRNDHQLEFKFNEQGEKEHRQSTERVFSLFPDPDAREKMNALFTRFLPNWSASSNFSEAVTKNNLTELACINNTREVYVDGAVHLSVDHVEGLGDFLEVEMQCEEDGDTSGALALLHEYIADLDAQHIRVGYVELWLRIHNPQAYQLGKYRL